MRRAARTDSNHAEIVKALKACGCKVLDLSKVGGGCPDLAVNVRGQIRFVEIKDGSRSPSERRLTPAQVEFHAGWPVSVVESVSEAMAIAGGK